MATSENLPFNRVLVRSKDGVEVFSIPSERSEEASITPRADRQFLLRGNTTFQALHPHGTCVFVHKAEKGIYKVDLTGGNNAAAATAEPFLVDTARVQIMAISPQGSFLLTWERPQEGEQPNLKVWDTNTGAFVIGFRQKRLSREAWPYLQWTNNEAFAFLLGTNEVRVYPGAFAEQAATRFVDKMRIPGITTMSVPSTSPAASARILFTSFCLKDKNKPSMAALYEYPSSVPAPSNAPYPPLMSKSLFQAEEMRVKWSPKGDCALITLHTSVDTSGKSYYGNTSLFHMSPLMKEVIPVPLPQEGTVFDVAWMPNPNKAPCFAVAAGKMPAMTSLHNGNDAKATFLFGNNHLNTVVWSPHGRFVNLSGFGNLAGGMTFWDRNKEKRIPPASPVTASCTVGFGWSPDSRLFLTSTTSPRINVDNAVNIYRYNGEKMAKLPWKNSDYMPDKLLEAAFIPCNKVEYPDRPQSPGLKDAAEVAAAAPAAAKPAGRYIPPSARNRTSTGMSLADRMRAERDGSMVTAQKVVDKPKQLMGATGKTVVGMAPAGQGKSKSALKREKQKQKKQEEEAKKALEEKMAQAPAPAEPAAVDPEKRARKIKKTLKQIDDLKAKDPSSLNDDQKAKIASEAELQAELAKLSL
eukprot:Nitzschia sp. Nitz4//scaffold14_size191712//6079//7995//NITZ4_001699-RA/size191712-processed-gene-0.257-mRNA-1//1//CDS//3329536855//4145//frame0